MAATLLLLEATATFTLLWSWTFFWARVPLAGWVDACALIAQTLLLTGCVLAACYYNRLYEPRVVTSRGALLARLPATFCLAFALVLSASIVCPKIRIAQNVIVSSLLATVGVIVGIVLPVHVTVVRVLGRESFIERVMIIGSGPLADKLIDEIESQHTGRYIIVGIAPDERADDSMADPRTAARPRPARKP